MPKEKQARRGERSRSAAVHEIGHEQPTVEELKAIAAGRRAYRRGEVVAYFAERARRASAPKALKIPKRAEVGQPLMKGHELRPRRKR